MKRYKTFINESRIGKKIYGKVFEKWIKKIKDIFSKWDQKRKYSQKTFNSIEKLGVEEGKSKYLYLNAMFTFSMEEFLEYEKIPHEVRKKYTTSFWKKNNEIINDTDGKDTYRVKRYYESEFDKIIGGILEDLRSYNPIDKGEEEINNYIESVFKKADDKIKKLDVFKPYKRK